MGYRKVSLVPGEYFHIYNRGNSKQKIFLDDEDKDRFVKLLYLYNSKKNIKFREDIVDAKIDAWDFERGETLISLGAWVIMPNHFHLYITSPIPGMGEVPDKAESRIALFMRKLCVGYAKYFNNKYGRTGTLFEGKFKAVHIDNDVQAKYLFSYIHLNPIKLIQNDWKEKGILDKDKALSYLRAYKYSSYLDYLGLKRPENNILNTKAFPDYFPTFEKFKTEIFEWLSFNLEARL